MITYFIHDVNASQDSKILRLLMKHGNIGYGIFWRIIEIMAQSNDGYLSADFNLLGYLLREKNELVKSVVCDFGLFEFSTDSKSFTSNRLQRNIISAVEKSEKMRQAGIKSGESRKNKSSTEVQQEFNKCSTDVQQEFNKSSINAEQIKINEIKRNETKKDISFDSPKGETQEKGPVKRFVKPTIEEINDYGQGYLKEKGYLCQFNAERFFDFYESNGWKVGKNPMKDWKATVRNWIGNNDYNSPSPTKPTKTVTLNENDVLKGFLNGK